MSNTKAEFVNPFVSAAFSVIGMILLEEPERGQITGQASCFTSDQVNVVVGVTGDAVGTVILGMSLATADKVASAMIGTPVKTFDALAASAIAELGNMISGNAVRAMSDAGWVCDIAPPTVIRGNRIQISTVNVPAIVIRLMVSHGPISLTLGLDGSKAAKAA